LSAIPTLYDVATNRDVHFVILAIADLEETVRHDRCMHFVTRDTYYKHERVWRVGRKLTEAEVRETPLDVACRLRRQVRTPDSRTRAGPRGGWFEFKRWSYRGERTVTNPPGRLNNHVFE